MELYSDLQHEEYAGSAKKYASLVEVIDSVREAKVDDAYVVGDYRWQLSRICNGDYKQLLRIRSLLARGRARPSSASSTPGRLLDASSSAGEPPRTSRATPADAPLLAAARRHPRASSAGVPDPRRADRRARSAGVPDPVYWRLGDWRRPCTLPACR